MRIAIAGFQHETNTFSPTQAGLAEFQMADSWPELLLGDKVISGTLGMNLPIAGAVTEASDLQLVPILWCAAEPGGPVTDEAFEWITARLLSDIEAALPLDGIYLDLHGAMVTDSYQDGEAEILRRLRLLVGDELPVAVSLDLHANVSARMVELASVLAVFRTYPHLDMAATGARCFRYLKNLIAGQTGFAAFRQLPFLVPLHAQYTGMAPCKSLYAGVSASDETAVEHVELSMGFTSADVFDCGPSVVAYAESQARANQLADETADAVIDARAQFDTRLISSLEAVQLAMASSGNGPIVIADVQDNAGAGGTADTTGLLHALLKAGASNAILGVLCDAEVAAEAHQRGLGSVFSASLGSRSGIEGDQPLAAEFRVLALSERPIPYQGAMYGGGVAEVGKSCLLAVVNAEADVKVVVSSQRIQCLDQALFRHFGVDLGSKDIIVVKSTVHYRADFETLTDRFINAEAPGAFVCDLHKLDYLQLRPGVEPV